MALRNYMYYKQEDQLKDKIAHGFDIKQIENITPRSIDTPIGILNKAKKLTPTQILKLERLKLEREYREKGDQGEGKENQENKS